MACCWERPGDASGAGAEPAGGPDGETSRVILPNVTTEMLRGERDPNSHQKQVLCITT